MKSFEKFNESLKDKMTPKPKDSIENSLCDYFNEYLLVESGEEFVLETGVFDKDIQKNQLYFIFDYEDYYDIIDNYFRDISEGQNNYQMTIHNDEYTCYPDKKIVLYKDDVMTEGWYFDTSVLDGLIKFMMENQLNESLRDKMLPKSKDDIDYLLKNQLKDVTPGKETMAKFLLGCENGLLWLVEESLSEGADINYQDGYFLVIAAHSGSVEVVKYLLDKGITTRYIEDAINVSATSDMVEVCRWLKQYRTDHKINESVRSKMTPKSEKELNQAKEEIINYIKEIVGINGGEITMRELEADSSPVYDEHDGVIDLIETLYVDKVEVEEYDNFAEAVLGEYYVQYEELEPHTLLDIKNLIEHGIEYELISVDYGPVKESVRDFMKPKPKDELRQVLDRLPERERLAKGISMEVFDQEEIDKMLGGMTPREFFLNTFVIEKNKPFGNRKLLQKAIKLIKPYKRVRPGDLLTISSIYKPEKDIPLGKIVKKEVFKNREEFKDYMKEKGIDGDDGIKQTYQKNTWKKVNCVIADVFMQRNDWSDPETHRVIFEYGTTTGVFHYTQKELEDYK